MRERLDALRARDAPIAPAFDLLLAEEDRSTADEIGCALLSMVQYVNGERHVPAALAVELRSVWILARAMRRRRSDGRC